MTRDEAFAVFLATVEAAIPEGSPDWVSHRHEVRLAGANYAHAAAAEAHCLAAIIGEAAK